MGRTCGVCLCFHGESMWGLSVFSWAPPRCLLYFRAFSFISFSCFWVASVRPLNSLMKFVIDLLHSVFWGSSRSSSQANISIGLVSFGEKILV